MKPSVVFSMTIAATVASACATTGGPGMSSNDCMTSSGKCEVAIKVTEPCDARGSIAADPPTLVLNGKRNQKIEWELPNGYEFCPANRDGIVFKYGDLDFQFYDPEFVGSGTCKKKFKWTDKNDPWTKGKEYSYLIKFTGPKGSCMLDPFIRNS